MDRTNVYCKTNLKTDLKPSRCLKNVDDISNESHFFHDICRNSRHLKVYQPATTTFKDAIVTYLNFSLFLSDGCNFV